jgi:hypothetical protein
MIQRQCPHGQLLQGRWHHSEPVQHGTAAAVPRNHPARSMSIEEMAENQTLTDVDPQQPRAVPRRTDPVDWRSDHRLVSLFVSLPQVANADLCRGFVATFQAFQHGLGAFMATRLLLGYALS